MFERTRFCLVCASELQAGKLDLGRLPPCNRFETAPGNPDPWPFILAACTHCGLVQLLDPPPIASLVPRLPWIRYNEPEAHLDDLALRLEMLSGGASRAAYGVGPFDGPLLARLQQKGLDTEAIELLAHRPETQAQAGFPYLESLQASLRPETLIDIAAGRPKADILVCRYLLEHSRDPVASLRGFKHLVQPDGLVVVEVPDSSKFIARSDYSFLWEEHVSYFVEATLANLAEHAGYGVAGLLRYEGELEDALVAVLRPRTGKAASQDPSAQDPSAQDPSAPTREAVAAFAVYAGAFGSERDRWHADLARLTAGGRKLALIGIGHQAVMFVNALGLQPLIAYAVDDDANKQGYYPPGLGVPIVPSAAILADTTISACLLAVNPRVAEKVRQKLRPMLERGVALRSIFAGAADQTLIDTRS
jgi:hypothetical protein